MSGDILQEILVEFLEVWLHNVIYKANLYPSQIFRSRYKYNISVKQSSYPPLNNYVRKLVLSLQPELHDQSIQSLTVNIEQELETRESFNLTISYPDTLPLEDIPSEKIISDCKDAFRGHIVSVLNSPSQKEQVPSEKRTFSVSVGTSELVASQMTAWCAETVPESEVPGIVEPLLFTDMALLRIQSSHRV